MKNLQFIIRMFRRNPLLVFVNLPGLAIGLSAVLLLSIYLKHEFSFDQHFKTKDRVLRLYNSVTEKGQIVNYGICLRDSYSEIPQQVPEIQSATQIYRGWSTVAEFNQQKYTDLQLLFADKGFFDVFGLELLYGNTDDALLGDNKVVLTASTALKLFNRTDCVGEVISISEEPFTVSGVMQDLPNNTHFQFDQLASMETMNPEQFGGLEYFTYYRIADNADLKAAGTKISAANNRLMKSWGRRCGGTGYIRNRKISGLAPSFRC